MNRPHIQWKGSVETEAGVAIITAGPMRESIELPNFATSMLIQKLLDRAYIDGARDAIAHASRELGSSLDKVKSLW